MRLPRLREANLWRSVRRLVFSLVTIGVLLAGIGSQPLAAAATSLDLVATAYGPSLADNYPYPPVDFFGHALRSGDIAVDPKVIPLGSVLRITGYTSPYLPSGGMTGVACDEGDAIQGNRIDIFINASDSAVSSFGMQNVTATLVGRDLAQC